MLTRLVVVLCVMGLAGGAQAADTDGSEASAREIRAADTGAFAPQSLSGPIAGGDNAAVAWGYAGYDSANQTAIVDVETEVRLWGPIAIRGGAVYTSNGNTLKPLVGARVEFLARARAGVDASVGVFYKPEGLTEPEGEVEAVLAFGRRFGALTTIVNLVFGQDGEGSERDGEVRLAAVYRVSARAQVGFDSRVRFDLGEDDDAMSMDADKAKEADFDLVAGPTATYAVGGVVLLGQVGLSVVDLDGTRAGVIALGGVGAAF